MVSISRHTGQTLLFGFIIFYALLVAWSLLDFSQDREEEKLAWYNGQALQEPLPTAPSFSQVHFSRVSSGSSFGSVSTPRKFRLRGSSYGGGYAFSVHSVSPVGAGGGGGLYTTSSAQVHSYGGGSTGMLPSGGSRPVSSEDGYSAFSAGSPIPTLALNRGVRTSSFELLPEATIEEDAHVLGAPAASASAGVWKQGTYYSPVRSAATTGWMSADDWLNGARSSRGRRYGPPTGMGIEEWLEMLIANGFAGYTPGENGGGYFDEAELKAYYLSHKGESNMPGSWTEIEQWFRQGGDDPKYSFTNPTQNPTPVGEMWVLLVLALGYALYKYLIGKPKRAET